MSRRSSQLTPSDAAVSSLYVTHVAPGIQWRGEAQIRYLLATMGELAFPFVLTASMRACSFSIWNEVVNALVTYVGSLLGKNSPLVDISLGLLMCIALGSRVMGGVVWILMRRKYPGKRG
jgi:hypothetical protein